jgi:uncharacterized protein YcbK (DUF882 family)
MTGLHPQLSPWADALVRLYPLGRVTSTYRSYTEQLQLWLTRSTNPYPVAPPGRSYHQLGRAFDFSAPTAVLHELGAIWRSWGGTWSPSDPIHFQA